MQQQSPPRYTRYEDTIAGLVLIAIALFALWMARDYPVGTMANMGPGWFPRAMCAIIFGLGLIMVITNLLQPIREAASHGTLKVRPLLAVVASYIAFALTLKVVGLLPAVLILIIIAALAVPRRSILELVLIVLALQAMTLGMWSLVRLSVPLFGPS